MNQQEASALVKKYGSIRAASRATGITRSTIQRRIKGVPDVKKPTEKSDLSASTVGRKLSDFRAVYDKDFIIPLRVREGLKKLGCNGWDYEVQFAKSIGVSLMDLGAYRDQFADYVVQISRDGRRAWAGSVSTAKQMREMVS